MPGISACPGPPSAAFAEEDLGTSFCWRSGRDISRSVLFRFWFGSVWFGWVRFGSDGFGLVRFGSVRFGSVWFTSRHFGSVHFGSVWFDLGFVIFGLAGLVCVLFWVFDWFGLTGLVWIGFF